jgi:hypothetical protein
MSRCDISNLVILVSLAGNNAPLRTTRNFTAFPDATAIAYTEKTRQGYLLYGMQ